MQDGAGQSKSGKQQIVRSRFGPGRDRGFPRMAAVDSRGMRPYGGAGGPTRESEGVREGGSGRRKEGRDGRWRG